MPSKVSSYFSLEWYVTSEKKGRNQKKLSIDFNMIISATHSHAEQNYRKKAEISR